ncbi:MAG: ABC transporter permease [Firmicutes bacterium]|nr:ABC transporter permease [Bacillota bacterium]
MFKYLIRRILSIIPVLLGVSVVVFLMVHLIPGDPAMHILGEFASPERVEQLREQLGLNDPLPIQYLKFLSRAVQGDLGNSLISNKPVVQEILRAFPVTIQLAFYSIILSSLIGLVAGVIASVKHNTVWDQVAMITAMFGISTPSFWLALILMWVFAYTLGWFPISGYSGLRSLVLPTVVLAALTAGSIARFTRSSMLEVLGQDYIRTARAKGLSSRSVVLKHALRNAMIPVVTLVGLEFGSMLAGAIITETVFALPGIGRLAVTAITTRDFPMIQGIVLFVATLFVITNLVVDMVYGYIDPRIRLQ